MDRDTTKALRYVEADRMGWFIVRIPPGREVMATRVLESHGFAATYPTHVTRKKRHHRGKAMVEIERPLLHGYVFVAFSTAIRFEDLPWFKLKSLHVVTSIVGDGFGKPLRVPYSGEHGLWRLFFPPDILRKVAAEQERKFGSNDRVKITAGPFSGFEGIVEDLGDADARILVELFGRKAQVRTDQDSLALVERAA